MSRVLVTGGAGFIGTHLVDALVARGEDVVVVDSFEEQVHGKKTHVHGKMNGRTVIVADVADRHAMRTALRDVDRVVHLAAVVGVGQSMYEIERYVRKNTLATASMLEVIVGTGVERLVVASSMSIYGEGEKSCEKCPTVPGKRTTFRMLNGKWEVPCALCGCDMDPEPSHEDDPLRPTSVYAITKRDQEELCLAFGAAHSIPSVALRFFNAYGVGQSLSNPYTGVAAIFASRLLNGRPPIIFEDGQQSRDFIHVSDIVSGLIAALDSDVAGEAINLGTGEPTTVLDVARILGSELDHSIEPEVSGQFRAGDIRHCFADAEKAFELLGWEPSVSIEAGLRELADAIALEEAHDFVEQHIADMRRKGLST